MDQLFYGNYFPCNFMQYLIYQTEFHENSDFFQILCKYMEKLYGIPWEKKPPRNSMKFHERKKNLHGFPWNSMSQTQTEFHRVPWKIFHRTPWNFHGTPWNSMEFHVPNPDRIPWSSMENFPWNSMEFHGIPWGYFTRVTRSIKTSVVNVP